MKLFVGILLIAITTLASSFADGSGITDEEDSMFSSSSSEITAAGNEEPASLSGNLVEDLTDNQDSGIEYKGLEYEAVRIGGSFDFKLSNNWIWQEDLTGSSWTTPAAEGDLFNSDLKAELFFEARPDTNTKYFGKIGIDGPLFTIADAPVTALIDETRTLGDIITIKELFADFNYNEDIFFRVGKQTINSGVGYFYSPADVLSLAEIDPEDPTAILEGPLSIKASMPIALNNIYLFAVVDEQAVSVASTAVIPAAEFVIENTEVSIGGYFRADQDPRLYATLTTSIFDNESIFAEALVGYGTGTGVKLDGTDALFAQLTGGVMLNDSLKTDDDFNISTYTLAGQYLYNYGDPDRLINITMPGDHYLTVMGSLSAIAETDLSLAATYQANISDGSGRLYATAGYKLFDGFQLNANALWTTGEPGDEYTSLMPGINGNDRVALSLSATLGSGIF
jgi:hypothetical protein